MKKKAIERIYKGVTYRQSFTKTSTCNGCAFNDNQTDRCKRPKCFTETCIPFGKPSYIWKRVTPELVDYTVILLYPDFMTDSYPQFFSAVVAARNPVDAVAAARKRVAFLNKEGLDEDADLVDLFMVVSVHRGAHKELNPEA
jgi:hypothetical protein